MSSSYRLDRIRWKSKEMRVLKWLRAAGEHCHHDEPLCVVSIDGQPQTLPFLHDDPPVVAGIYYTLVDEGEEVGPSGALIEYQWGRTLADPELHQSRLNKLGLRPPIQRFHRRESYCPIFMSYRRADSEIYAGRLHEALEREFGPDSVFMDVFDTQPGDQFTWAIQQAAAHARGMVVVIGPKWASIETNGTRRLHSPGDLLACEVAAALDRRIPIFPVFVDEAPLLSRGDLPLKLSGLEGCQAYKLTGRYWSAGVRELTDAIRRTVDETPVPAFVPEPFSSPPSWTDFGVLSQALLAQPSMNGVLALLVKAKDPGVTNLLVKYASADNDSEARRLARRVLLAAGASWSAQQ